jgi:multiple sugar transport system substrate-binding protein
LLPTSCVEGSDTSEGDRTTIRFQFAGEAEEAAVYRTLVAAFEDEHPDINVEPVAVASKDDHLQKLTTSFVQGDPPDVFLLNFREYSQYVGRGALDPVGPRLAEFGVDLGEYYEAPLEAFEFDGELQCMPQNVSSLVVYYNTALFEAVGLERPPADWGWEDFRDYALALNDPANDVRGVGIEPSVIRLAPFVWSNGGEVVDDLDSPTRFTLNDGEAREALDFLVSLVRDDGVVPTEEEIAAQDLETRFSTGKLGMVLSSRRETPFFRENSGLQWDVASLPVGGQPTGILHSDGYCMAAEGTHPEEAMSFVAFATGRDGETVTALGGRTVPSLISVAESGAFLDPIQPPEHSEVFLEAIPILRRTPVIPTWPEIEDVAEEILTRIFYEPGYTIDQGLRDLGSQTRALFEEGASS